MKTSHFKAYYQLAKAKRNMFMFLSTIFLKEPSKDLIERLVDEKLLSQISEVFGDSSAALLKSFMETCDQGVYEDIAIEYASLFIVPGNQYVTPYESVYRTGLVYREPAIAVLQMYEKAGVRLSDEYMDLPDHIGLELDFMRFLCEKEAESWMNSDGSEALKYLEIQRDFLRKHLASWTPELCDKILKSTKSDFYRAMAEMTKGFLKMTRSMVEELLKDARPASIRK